MVIYAEILKITDTQIIIKCPYCHKKHYHGRGTGFRGPHCAVNIDKKEDYYLVDKKDTYINK